MKTMNNLSKFSMIACCLSACLFTPVSAMAGHADKNDRGVEGSVTCGGNYLFRMGGTEVHRSTMVLRNFSDAGPISLDRVRVYNATGALIFDSNVSGMPPFVNNILSSSDNILDQRQSAQLNLPDFIPAQGSATRPLQTVFDWSATEPTLTLDVVHVRTVSDFDPVTGKVGRQIARNDGACRTTSLRRFKFDR
jgi:hypothetical protein